MRTLRSGGIALLGLLAGSAAMLGLQGPAAQEPAAPRAPTAATEPATTSWRGGGVLLVWAGGGLPKGLAGRLAVLPQVSVTTAVGAGLVELRRSFDADGRPVDDAGDGWTLPLDAIAVDPVSFAAFAQKSAAAAIAGLRPGEVLLSETSARLRRLGTGGLLELAGGRRLRVAGVVDDGAVGAAEVAVTRETGAALGLPGARYLLLAHDAGRDEVERAVRGALPEGLAARVRAPGETPFLRHGDAVLPQALVKVRFGEFRVRRAAGRDIVQDPVWAREHLVREVVPILGEVVCHRAFLPALRGALEELQRRNLAWLVDPAGFAGCHAARLVSAGGPLSRHAWGIAVDLNWHKNPLGRASTQDPRLVEAMRRWGLTWGGEWLVPDAAHFEFLRLGD